MIRVILKEKGVVYEENDLYIECLNKLLGNTEYLGEVDSLNSFLIKQGQPTRASLYDCLAYVVGTPPSKHEDYPYFKNKYQGGVVL